MLNLILEICDRQFKFDNFEQCNTYFKEVINICRQMNYSEYKSEQFDRYYKQLMSKLNEEDKQ